MTKKFLFTLITIAIIGFLAAISIFLARGYTISSKDKTISGTGIITVSSVPDSASVYVDGHLTTATNATVSSLPPKTYDIKVIKEGFIPWEKNIEVKEGLVSEIKIVLFPAIPTTYPLSFTGAINPVLSPDQTQFAYIVPSATTNGGVNEQSSSSRNKKAGVWVWTMAKNQPISFVRSSEPHQVAFSTTTSDFSKAVLKWSPDSKQLLATIGNNNFVLFSDRLNTDPKDITPTLVSTLKTWTEDTAVKDQTRIATIKDFAIRRIASESGFLNWSPDETKFIARKESLSVKEASATAVISNVSSYDLEQKKQFSLPSAKAYIWLPDSLHIILIEDNMISVAEYDGKNKAVIYAGTFLSNFVIPWPDSSRLVFINSLPTPTASEPNLYGVNLK